MSESESQTGLTRRAAARAIVGGGTAVTLASKVIAKPTSDPKISALSDKFKEAKISALLVSRNGRRIHAEGDLTTPYYLHSMRKSMLSMIFGIAVKNGYVHMDDTLAPLGIEDIPALTDIEKTATVRHLLKARSGVYIPAAAEAPTMKARRPVRGSHAPDTFWYYNNWDFNALGRIYERQTASSIFIGLQHWLAEPLGFQDFNVFNDTQYDYEPDVSQFPAYVMQISARDLERVGLMLLNNGKWNGRQVIPADWIAESTKPYSRTNYDDALSGYGYLWWVAMENSSNSATPLPPDTFTAAGAGGHYLTVIPSKKMVVVIHSDDDVDSGVADPKKFCEFMIDVMAAAG